MKCHSCKHCRTFKHDAHIACAKKWDAFAKEKPEIHHFGVENGWCYWPVNFDPIWVDGCKSFEQGESLSIEDSHPQDLCNIANNSTTMKVMLKEIRAKWKY